MTRPLTYSAILLVLILSSECRRPEKNIHSYIPVVQTLSAKTQPDGSVVVTGLVVSGHTPIAYAGFCMDTMPNPDIMTNQVFAAVNGDTFSCTYKSLNALKRYYFRAWAGNGEAYAAGKDVFVDSASFDTTLIPCHFGLYSLTFTGPFNPRDSFVYFDKLAQSAMDYSFTAYTNLHRIGFTFGIIPTSGFYTVTDADEPGSKGVIITFDGITSKAGSTLYLRQITNSIFEITICDVQVFISPYNNWYSMATRFRATM